MSKRRPDFQLTKDNFDDERDEDVEIINEPPKANLDVLKERVVLKAKRRMPSEQGSDSPVAFSGFKGFSSSFGSSTVNNNNTNTSFGKFNLGQSNVSSTFGSSMATTKVSTNFGGTFIPGSSAATTTIVKNDDNGNNSFGKPFANKLTSAFKVTDNNNNNNNNNKSNSADDTFAANLTQLNNMFFNHIKKYMDLSALYDFTAVCEQYVNHYKKIKDEKSKSSSFSLASSNKPNSVETKLNNSNENVSKFTFGEKKAESLPQLQQQQQSSTFKIPTFSANLTSTPSLSNNPTFTFGSTASNNLFPSSFAASAKTPSTSLFPTFNVPITKPPNNAETEQQQCDNGDDEPPPKVVSVEHNEENSVYSIKCKLYYKKEESFVEKGLSFLYIKVDNSDSDDSSPQEKPAQLLIRANTSTGNILLNIALVESLPVLKADKGKGVLLTCIPNPPIDSKSDDQKSVTYLIRVKQTECDHLYDNLMKYKSSSKD